MPEGSVQVYETTIASRELGISLTAMTVPARAIPFSLPEDEDGLAQTLAQSGVEVYALFNPTALTPALFALLGHPLDAERAVGELYERFDAPLATLATLGGGEAPAEVLSFIEQVAHAPVIAFEQSPLTGASLSGIASGARTLGLGAALGFASVGPTPFLFLAVPAGIIVVGTALAFTEGLRHHIYRWMGIPEEQRQRSDVSA